MFDQVSIIIPVHKQETQLETLLSDLSPIQNQAEILVCSEGSRAKSLNAGASLTQRPILWFLHADSRITTRNLEGLIKALQCKPNALHYFDLAIDTNGYSLFRLNAWSANWRSRIFGVPFGDQGFCISRNMFEKIGGYPENLAYGEDLKFVWKARQNGIHLNRIPVPLMTSGRRYSMHGWLRTTVLYQFRWIKMSVPEAIKLVMKL
jgi:hypothetical protein